MKNYITRNIEPEILKLAKSFPVIMVTGPRQVGKFTLLNILSEKINKKITYVTLDNIDNRMLAIEDPKLFLETYKAPLIIDEFQYAPDLLSYLKIEIDNKRLEEFEGGENSNGMYFLTGSQKFIAMNQVSESLAGRVGIIDLYGLSNSEINKIKNDLFIPDVNLLRKRDLNNYNPTHKEIFERIYRGSFPELYINKNIETDTYYENYIKTYIEKDIRKLINVKDEIKFMKFITSIAARTAQELNINEVADDAEISNPTANEWLSILVNTGLVILLEPYTKNIIKRVVKRPKIHFLDTGLATYLAKYPSPEILESSYYAGAIFESFVVSEIVKSFSNNGLEPKRHLYYYRDNKKNEIDLIIEYENKLYPIEIKKSKKPNKNSIKNFDVLKETKKEIAKGSVLCMIDDIFPVDKDNYYIPIKYI